MKYLIGMKTKKPLQTFLVLAVLTAFLATGCGSIPGGGKSTISVSGAGTVTAEPDMVKMNVTLSHTAATTGEAQEEVSRKVRNILGILKDAGVEDKNIRTASLNFSPEYEWNNGTRSFLGQKAEQTIVFSVYGIQDDPGKVPELLDRIARVDGVEMRQMTFDIQEKAGLFTQSRELAYQKALAKAEEYAALSGLRVDKALSISEAGNHDVYLAQSNLARVSMDSAGGGEYAKESSTVLPTGEIEVTTNISVIFLLK